MKLDKKILREMVGQQLSESFNKRHFLNLIKQEIDSLKGQIAYAKDALRQKDIEDWEKKEFTAVLKDKTKDLKDTEKNYKRVKKLKEGKLTETKFYAFYNRKKHTIDGKSLYDAKQKAITKLKVPKSKVGMLSIVNAKEHDRGGYRFEGKLTEKWDSPQAYSSKEAKKVIDDELKKWAKDLRQVQYRVVKTWMSLAKKGVIDYFDLVRGLTTGDIARAKPYETKFLKSLLDRDKIMDRFRSYFGGKKGKRQRRK